MVQNTAEIPYNLPTIKHLHHERVVLKHSFKDTAGIFSGDTGTVVLLSGGNHDCSQYHILAVNPWLTLSGKGDRLTLQCMGNEFFINKNPFDFTDELVKIFSTTPAVPDLPVNSGLFGYFAYDLKDRTEDLPVTCLDNQLPDISLYSPSAVLIQEKSSGTTTLMIPVIQLGSEEHNPQNYIEKTRDVFLNRVNQKCYDKNSFFISRSDLKSTFTKSAYMESVKKVRNYLKEGDIYQANLSQRFETKFSGDSYALFIDLFQRNPAPFFAYINAGSHQIVSTSPERFIKRDRNKIETRPIKGTISRGRDQNEDNAFCEALTGSIKDDAELTMIVDLMRNDLSKVAKSGTVIVKEHKRLEPYDNVFHLVSVVQGELEEEKSSVDFLRTAFPGGSITGCPKIRSMEIIDELEPVKRHIYTGSIGYISFHDTLDLSIAIRTVTVFEGHLWFSVGGGIVFDSDPEKEFQETLDKGKTIMETLSCNARYMDEPSNKAWINGRIVDAENGTVNPASIGFQYGAGLFETIRVDKGELIRIFPHIERLNSSWQSLFNEPPPDITWEAVIRRVINCNKLEKTTAAVKIIVAKDMINAGFPFFVAAFARKYVHRLKILKKHGLELIKYPFPRHTQLADYKSLNYLYYYLAGEWARKNGGDEALIMNPDMTVSETNSCSIMIITPNNIVIPESTYVLKGITQKTAVDKLRKRGWKVTQKKIAYKELCSQSNVVLTNALMGAVPVISIDGIPLEYSPGTIDMINSLLFEPVTLN